MDDVVQRFRRQAGRELGRRQGAERRYSDGLRQHAVAYWRARERAGDGLCAVAAALGIAPVMRPRRRFDINAGTSDRAITDRIKTWATERVGCHGAS